ncbi:MAG TPA: hypothetical protein VM848_16860 [Acidimicrobiia bacterium]|nr:hypothetical protein [Acidimicrobiia bacterium]
MQRIAYLVALVVVMAVSVVALTQWIPDAPVHHSASGDPMSATYGDEESLVHVEGLTASNTTATAEANTTLETATSAETATTLASTSDARHQGTRPPDTRPPDAPPPDTTTTAPPTTTTTQPPTTITFPETIISPTGARFAFPFSVIQAGVNIWWAPPYLFELPYQTGYGWGIGDRISYLCSYGHLIEGGVKVGEDVEGGLPVGRFAVTVLEESSGYMLINGAGHGNRFFDGTENTGTAVQLYPNQFCHDLDGIHQGSYEPSDGVAETPLILFRNADGQVVEIRDYRNTAVGVPGVHFQLTDADGSDGTVAVVAYGPDNIPGAVVYYSGLNGGTVEAFLP